MTVVALTSSESAQLARCEAVVESGLRTFVDVGEALMEIRDRRLWRDGFDSFEDYCRERWGFSRKYAHLIVAEAEVNQLVDHPIRQSTARELVPLKNEPEKLREAWVEANDRAEQNGRKVTAEIVREVVTDFKPSLKNEAKKLGMGRKPNLHDAAVMVVSESIQRGTVYHVPAKAMRALMLAIGKE